ncbi:acyl-CoA dehydrogenase family protein [Thalassiella azotivora]
MTLTTRPPTGPAGDRTAPRPAGDLADVDLLYSDVEEDLRASVRDLLAARCDWQQVLAAVTTARSDRDPAAVADAALWDALAVRLGLAGLTVPETVGGAGAGAREAAVVLEELGRRVAPVPYLGSSVVAAAVLTALPAGAARDDLLRRLADGTVVALGLPAGTGPGLPGAPGPVADVRVSEPGGDGPDAPRTGRARVSGTVPTVPDALGAQVLLVPTAGGLLAVEVADGVAVVAVPSLDPTRPVADVRLDGAAGTLLTDGAGATDAVTAGLTAGAALLASEQLGVAEWCLEETRAYLSTRYQFGRPLGTFQALRHRLADLWTEVTQGRAVARYAADRVAAGSPDAAVAASLAQAGCAPLALRAAEECVQLHGGIGFTWEHPAHLYLKRATAAALTYGTPEHHRRRLASLVDLPPAP